MASRSGQSSYNPYDVSGDDEEFLRHTIEAETTPRLSHCAAHVSTAARIFLNSQREFPQNWGQISPNLNDYHAYLMEISRAFWWPDITDWWHQQVEMHSQYTDLSYMARNVFSIILHGVALEAMFSIQWDMFGWRQSKKKGGTHCEKVIVRQFAWTNNGILAGYDPALDMTNTENTLEMKREADGRKLHRMVKVNEFLEMWHRSQNLRATEKEFCTQKKQITALGNISDTYGILKAS